jgi:hypothetical protein
LFMFKISFFILFLFCLETCPCLLIPLYISVLFKALHL